MRLITRLLQRLLIVGLGVATVWLIVFVVFRFVDHRLPWVLALGVTYGLAAYVILPRAVHMGLKILQRKHVPSFTVTGDGLPGDPVNLALIGTLEQLRSAFAKAGWVEADRLGLASSWRMACAFVFNSPYPTAPFSTLHLFGRGQDIGFQKSIDNSPRKRHHIRFWAQSLTFAEDPCCYSRVLAQYRSAAGRYERSLGRCRYQRYRFLLDATHVPVHPRDRCGYECGTGLYRFGVSENPTHWRRDLISIGPTSAHRTGQSLRDRRGCDRGEPDVRSGLSAKEQPDRGV